MTREPILNSLHCEIILDDMGVLFLGYTVMAHFHMQVFSECYRYQMISLHARGRSKENYRGTS